MVSPSLAIDGPPQNVRSYSLERSSSQNREHASTNEYSRILKPSLCLENGGSGEVGLTQYASSYPYRSDQWHIHWVGPTILLTGLVLGTGCAVAHHFFYLTYDGTEASEWSQQKVHFAGQAFARITSLLLTASAAAAYRQWVWSLLKRRALPISSIDTLFVLDSSVLELILGWRTWLIATTTMLFACMLWSLQVASIITPGAMSTKTHQWIRSANVSAQQARICQFGFTSTGSGNIGDSSQMACYEYYNEGFDRINTGLTRTISGTAYSGEIPVFDSPCNSENCTLEFDYVAPTLRCASMDNPSNLTEEFPNNPYLTDNLTEAYDPFLTFAGTSTGNPEYGDALEFNMTVLTGIEPITYESYTCNIWNTSMLYTFTFQQGKSTTISPAREPTLLNLVLYELSTGTSVLTWFSQVVNLLDGTVSGEKDTTGVIYDVSGISNTGVTVNANISYVRDTSLRRYIYTGADRLAAGYDPSAPGNIGTGLEELTRNISVAMSLMYGFFSSTSRFVC